MSRRPAPAADPLADLRAATQDGPLPVIATSPPAPQQPEPGEPVNRDTPAWHTDAARRISTAWHADDTAVANLHRGGTCGCNYLATTALRAALGAPVEPVEDEDEHQEDPTP